VCLAVFGSRRMYDIVIGFFSRVKRNSNIRFIAAAAASIRTVERRAGPTARVAYRVKDVASSKEIRREEKESTPNERLPSAGLSQRSSLQTTEV